MGSNGQYPHLVRTSPIERAMQRHAWRSAAAVRDWQEDVSQRMARRRRRQRLRRLSERAGGALLGGAGGFLVLISASVPWRWALVAATFSSVLVMLLLVAGDIEDEDLGHVRPGRRR